MLNKFVPVLSKNNKPLMPTTASRARRLIKTHEAIPFYKLGIFSIKLINETEENLQSIGIGIDSGSKKEAYSVASKVNHYLNIQCDAITWVKDNMETRSNLRGTRRRRKTPCRQPRWANRTSARLPPSIKARWQLKINILKKLKIIFPMTELRIENISSRSYSGKDKRNISFGPLQIGKKWFKKEIQLLKINFSTQPGYETSKLKKHFKLYKTKNKMSDDFSAHVVDSAVIVTNMMKGYIANKNISIMYLTPIGLNRRSLHKQQFSKSNVRTRVGTLRSKITGSSSGSIVKLLKPTISTLKANKKSIFLIGGYTIFKNKYGGKIGTTLSTLDNKSNRITQYADIKYIKHLCYNRYIYRFKND